MGKKCTGKYEHCKPKLNGFYGEGIWGCGHYDSSAPEGKECDYNE